MDKQHQAAVYFNLSSELQIDISKLAKLNLGLEDITFDEYMENIKGSESSEGNTEINELMRLMHENTNFDGSYFELLIKFLKSDPDYIFKLLEYKASDDMTGFEFLLSKNNKGDIEYLDSFPLVLPVGKTIRFLVTSKDVIHSLCVPSLGLKIDCIPGRLNEAIISTKRVGLLSGQCSELCGVEHFNMPILIRVVPKAEFFHFMLIKFFNKELVINTMKKALVNYIDNFKQDETSLLYDKEVTFQKFDLFKEISTVKELKNFMLAYDKCEKVDIEVILKNRNQPLSSEDILNL